MDGSFVDTSCSEGAKDSTLNVEFVSSLCGYEIRQASNRMSSDFTRAIKGTGLRAVLVSILSVVEENPGVNQGIVGEALGVARANVAPLMNDLEQRGLLRREQDARDRRAVSNYLTARGGLLLRECKMRIRAHEDKMLRLMSQEERRVLLRLLAQIARPQ